MILVLVSKVTLSQTLAINYFWKLFEMFRICVTFTALVFACGSLYHYVFRSKKS